MILFDELIYKVKEVHVLDHFKFKLLERNKTDEVIEVVYKGVWFMVDNGYLSWSCTVPPDNNATKYDIIRFSE